MQYQLNQKLADLVPYDPIQGSYRIRLDANESYISLPEELRRQIGDAVGALPLNRYPDPLSRDVNAAFAAYYGLDPDCVTSGNGSDELISIITSCFLESGDTIVTLAQDFSMYAFYSSLYELHVEVCPKREDLTIDVDALIAFCRKTHAKAVVFSNPCNPTSLGVNREEIRRLLESLDCLVILDEAYMDFWDQSMLPELSRYDNCIILKTCSKALGLAGIRLGFAVAGKTITRALRAAKSPYNTDMIAQTIGRILFNKPEYLRDCTSQITAHAKQLHRDMLQLQKQYSAILEQVYDSCTNFVFVKTAYDAQLYQLLLDASIAVRRFRGFLRICTGSSEENAALLEALTRSLDTICSEEGRK